MMNNVSKYYDENNVDLMTAINELGDVVEKPDQLILKITNVIDLMSKE